MNNAYHENRIKNAVDKKRIYTEKARKIQHQLISILGISPTSNEVHKLNGYLRFYPNDTTYDHIFKASKHKKMIELYQKYRSICHNYVKLISQYRKEYAEDEECDHYRKMIYLTDLSNTDSII